MLQPSDMRLRRCWEEDKFRWRIVQENSAKNDENVDLNAIVMLGEDINMDDLMEEYFNNLENETEQMSVLSMKSMDAAVRSFINKDNKQVYESFFLRQKCVYILILRPPPHPRLWFFLSHKIQYFLKDGKPFCEGEEMWKPLQKKRFWCYEMRDFTSRVSNILRLHFQRGPKKLHHP